MTETNESQENQNEEEAAVPTMTTVERAEMLLQQDAAIRAKINGGAALDEAVDPSIRIRPAGPPGAGADACGQARHDA